jgi:hypothetical protein
MGSSLETTSAKAASLRSLVGWCETEFRIPRRLVAKAAVNVAQSSSGVQPSLPESSATSLTATSPMVLQKLSMLTWLTSQVLAERTWVAASPIDDMNILANSRADGIVATDACLAGLASSLVAHFVSASARAAHRRADGPQRRRPAPWRRGRRRDHRRRRGGRSVGASVCI